jgi:2-keto-4-pentenoate hydratase/2-oxohepta-3-ene-1,7-dioic acid hydratase in catechol pathway
VRVAPVFTICEDQGSVHYELEIAILIAKPLTNATPAQVAAGIAGVGLALDLTLRDLQATLKEKGHPWERAKSFDGACPMTDFVSIDSSKPADWQALELILEKNGQIQQQGRSADMLFSILPLIAHMSENFSLQPGDVVLTGTPAGVGPLTIGDDLIGSLLLANKTLLTRVTVVA